MATAFLPPASNIRVIDAVVAPLKVALPTSSRALPSGCPLFKDTDGNADSPLDFDADTGPGTVDACNAYLIANKPFLGILAGARVPQQLTPTNQFRQGGAAAAYLEDASRPYGTRYHEGICVAPCDALVAQHEEGEYVQLDGFTNEATTGFYDAKGTLVKDTQVYLYDNKVCISATQAAANSIGVLTERALAGATELKFRIINTIG